MAMKVLVTGAGGFIGRAAIPRLLEQGHRVVALVRKPEDITLDHAQLEWRIGDTRDPALLRSLTEGVDLVVHLAAAKSDEADSYATNVGGAHNLAEACEESGVRGIVNISTISTKFSKKGLYARTKQEADEVFAQSGLPVITLRPSVVYGDPHSGIVGTLLRYTRLPVVPIIGDGTFTCRPLHVDDAALAIEKVLAGPWQASATYDLGGPDLVTFNDLTRAVARMQKKDPYFLHLPVWAGYAAARALKLVFKRPPVTLSNIMATNQEAAVDTHAFNSAYDFSPRSLRQGLSDLARASEKQHTEGYALLKYVAGKEPALQQLALYEQALEHYGLGPPLGDSIVRHPRRIGALDALTRFSHPTGKFRRKLLVAAALVECSPLSSTALLPRRFSMPQLLMRFAAAGLGALIKLAHGLVLACIPGLIKNNA